MSQESVEVVRRLFEIYNQRGIRALARDHWHPDIVWDVGPWAILLGGQRLWQGTEQAVAGFDELEAVMGRIFTEVLEVADAGEEVLLEVRVSGEGVGSGAAVDQIAWYAFRLEDGRVRHVRVFGDRSEALEAAGLREEDLKPAE